MHPTVKRFGMTGSIADDSSFLRLRAQYEKLLTHQMRDSGYVPCLSLGPLFSTKWVPESELYEFEISVYGVRVGKEKAWTLEGMEADGTYRLRHIPQAKSNPSSETAE